MSWDPSKPDDWRIRHKAAAMNPRTGVESALMNIFTGAAEYAEWYRLEYESPIGRDGVLGDGVERILRGLRVLLNGELGRLDGGEFDRVILELARSAGIDEDEL